MTFSGSRFGLALQMTIEIPLFPLRTVLFPGMPLPLRVFEERYKALTREILQTGGVFGVLLIKEGEEIGGSAVPYTVGSTALIEECQELDEGRFVISARGDRRFRLVRLLPPRPFPCGEIVYLDDDRELPAPRLQTALETVNAMFPAYFRLALSLSDQWARSLKLPRDPHALVNFLGPLLPTEDEVKQRLLETESAADRVALLAEILDELLERTREEVIDHHRRKFDGFGAKN